MNVFINVEDDDAIGNDDIIIIQKQIVVERPAVNGGKLKYLKKIVSGKVSVEYEIEFGCDKNFYGSNCMVWCIDDEHRICDRDGKVKCRNEGKDCNMTMKKVKILCI